MKLFQSVTSPSRSILTEPLQGGVGRPASALRGRSHPATAAAPKDQSTMNIRTWSVRRLCARLLVGLAAPVLLSLGSATADAPPSARSGTETHTQAPCGSEPA